MTIIDQGNGSYYAGDVDVDCGETSAQLHVNRYAEFSYSDLREFANFLIQLADEHDETPQLAALRPLFEAIDFHEANTPNTEAWRKDSIKVSVPLGVLRKIRKYYDNKTNAGGKTPAARRARLSGARDAKTRRN